MHLFQKYRIWQAWHRHSISQPTLSFSLTPICQDWQFGTCRTPLMYAWLSAFLSKLGNLYHIRIWYEGKNSLHISNKNIVYLRFEKLNFGSAGELAIDIKTIIYYGQCPALHRRALVYDAISPRNTPYFTNIYMKVRQLRFQHIPATNLFIINILTEIVAKYWCMTWYWYCRSVGRHARSIPVNPISCYCLLKIDEIQCILSDNSIELYTVLLV
jgi:hypothetical protein